jgi:manganese oxidase
MLVALAAAVPVFYPRPFKTLDGAARSFLAVFSAGLLVFLVFSFHSIAVTPTQAAPMTISPEELKAQQEAANNLLHHQALAPVILPDGTREYHLTASAFPWELYPGMVVEAWGYNHQVPGPLIRLKVDEKVKFIVRNELPQPTSLHWHGLAVPNAQDGVPGVSQKPIQPGGQFTYAFTVTPQMTGTHLYHTHVRDDLQMDKGLHGVLIIDPAGPSPAYAVEGIYEMSSFKIGNAEEENAFALNGLAYPEAPALDVPLGGKVLLRLVNASAEQPHVMHLHGYTFTVNALDGNPLEHPYKANTILLGPSQTADIAFTAANPGSWMFHCHILDHMINPSSTGGENDDAACMGGLVTFINVVPKTSVQTSYRSAGSIDSDPVCANPSP